MPESEKKDDHQDQGEKQKKKRGKTQLPAMQPTKDNPHWEKLHKAT